MCRLSAPIIEADRRSHKLITFDNEDGRGVCILAREPDFDFRAYPNSGGKRDANAATDVRAEDVRVEVASGWCWVEAAGRGNG
jgi:hypothetical protein